MCVCVCVCVCGGVEVLPQGGAGWTWLRGRRPLTCAFSLPVRSSIRASISAIFSALMDTSFTVMAPEEVSPGAPSSPARPNTPFAQAGNRRCSHPGPLCTSPAPPKTPDWPGLVGGFAGRLLGHVWADCRRSANSGPLAKVHPPKLHRVLK